jgi:hypothetical protein
MAGNVWEWVGDTYAPVGANHRVLRGGANGFLKDMAYRLEGDPQVPTMVATAGFRCAADQVEGGSQLVQIALAAPLAKGVLLQDAFTDPSSGWPIGEQEDGRFGYHPAAFYHVEVSKPNDRLASFRGLSFGDFTAQVDVLVDHTNTQNGNFRYGLALRRSGERYYAFTIAPRAKTWQVLKSSDSGLEVLAEGPLEASGGLHGVADRLRVDAAGPDFNFIVNDQPVSQVHDADYLSGDIGFMVETFDETLVHIHYAALTIRELEQGQTSLLLDDQFADPNSGWPVGEDERFRFGYHPPDYYHLETKVPNDHVVVTHEPDYTNVTAETKVLVDHTETLSGNFLYGLTLRRSGDQYYAFGISPRARSWQALKSSASGLQVLAEGNLDMSGDLATATTLRVDAAGPDFTFTVNGQVVTQVHDADYASGQVGFFLESFDEILAHVHYDTLSVRAIK